MTKLENTPIAAILSTIEVAPPLGPAINPVGDEAVWLSRVGDLYREARGLLDVRGLSALEVLAFGSGLISTMVKPPEITYDHQTVPMEERRRVWRDALYNVAQAALSSGSPDDRKWLLETVADIAQAVSEPEQPSAPQGLQGSQEPLSQESESESERDPLPTTKTTSGRRPRGKKT